MGPANEADLLFLCATAQLIAEETSRSWGSGWTQERKMGSKLVDAVRYYQDYEVAFDGEPLPSVGFCTDVGNGIKLLRKA